MIRDLPPLPKPKFPAIDPADVRLSYDRTGDILLLKFVPPRPATSVDVGGELWLRMDLITGDVTGIEIEGFEVGYLRKHPDLAESWRGVGDGGPQGLPAEARATLVQHILRVAKTSLPRSGWLPSASR